MIVLALKYCNAKDHSINILPVAVDKKELNKCSGQLSVASAFES